MESQNKAILKYLQKGKKLTGLEAVNMFQCLRLPARIKDLKNLGHNIDGKMIRVGKKRVKQYEILN